MTERRKRRSLLDQMQMVAEEQQQQNSEPTRSFQTVAKEVADFFADDANGLSDDESLEDDEADSDVDEMQMNRVLPLMEETPTLGGATIFEGEEEEDDDDSLLDTEDGKIRRRGIDGEDGSGLPPGAPVLDPLYEEGEMDDEDDESSISISNEKSFYYDDTQTSNSTIFTNEGFETPLPGYAAKRSSSFVAGRRSIRSTESSSDHMSISSLPNPNSELLVTDETLPHR